MPDKRCTLVNASHPDAVQFVWPYVREYILGASDMAKELDEFTIVGKILSGEYTLFVVTTDNEFIGAATVEIVKFPVRTIAQIIHLGGKDFKLMQSKFDELMDWARVRGAEALRLHGRKGWIRRLERLDFNPTFYVLERKL